MKEDLLFYGEYERFYAMAAQSEAFAAYCREAFGADFSQDGFSDLSQVERLAAHLPREGELRLLDAGCGNGKMLGWLQARTGAQISGFDYAENAIAQARRLFPEKSQWRVGVMGKIDYPPETFDAVFSLDTLYFAPDAEEFAAQVKRWLKPEGLFLIAYQEGELAPRTQDVHSTAAAKALRACGMGYEAEDITAQTRRMLLRKREAAQRHREDFLREGGEAWYEMLLAQTEEALLPEAEYQRRNARYLYIARKVGFP